MSFDPDEDDLDLAIARELGASRNIQQLQQMNTAEKELQNQLASHKTYSNKWQATPAVRSRQARRAKAKLQALEHGVWSIFLYFNLRMNKTISLYCRWLMNAWHCQIAWMTWTWMTRWVQPPTTVAALIASTTTPTLTAVAPETSATIAILADAASRKT